MSEVQAKDPKLASIEVYFGVEFMNSELVFKVRQGNSTIELDDFDPNWLYFSRKPTEYEVLDIRFKMVESQMRVYDGDVYKFSFSLKKIREKADRLIKQHTDFRNLREYLNSLS